MISLLASTLLFPSASPLEVDGDADGSEEEYGTYYNVENNTNNDRIDMGLLEDLSYEEEITSNRGIGKALRNCVHIGKRKEKNAEVVSVDDDGGGVDVGMTDYPFSQQAHQTTTTTTTQSSTHRLDNGGFGGRNEADTQFAQILFDGEMSTSTMNFSVGEDPSSEFTNYPSFPPPSSSSCLVVLLKHADLLLLIRSITIRVVVVVVVHII